MLVYLDERLKEATQNYDKPFGGVAVNHPQEVLLYLAMDFKKNEYKQKIIFSLPTCQNTKQLKYTVHYLKEE